MFQCNNNDISKVYMFDMPGMCVTVCHCVA